MEDTQLYRTLEAAAMVGITSEEPKNVRYLFMRIVKAMSLSPTYEKTREGKGGKPEKFWTAEQIDAIKEYYNAHRKNSSNVENNPTPNNEVDSVPDSPVTIEPVAISGETNNDDSEPSNEETAANGDTNSEVNSAIPAPISDVPAVQSPPFIEDIAVPLEGKSLQELANEGRLCFERGDDHIKQGLMYYVEGGRRLIEAKRRLPHGQWQAWLKEHFSFSQDTATNRMKLAERFAESKSDTFRNLGVATAVALLKLPTGKEEDFAREQAETGKPFETQSAREVQKNVRQWKQKHATEIGGKYINVTGAEKNNQIVEDLNHAVTPPVLDSNLETINAKDTRTIEPATADDDCSSLLECSIIKPEQFTAIRELINQTDDRQTIKEIRDSLLKLAREISEIVTLTEAKIGELSKHE